jgi:glycosyltransferase involved in cell wall biosynthesis
MKFERKRPHLDYLQKLRCSDVADRSPLISIGLPVYNGEKFVSIAIESVLAQTISDLELIICDNASTDSTEQICRHYAAQDERVRYLRNDENLGTSPNFNRAFREAKGSYFKWITHDDAITPDCIEKTLAMLRERADAVLCHSLVRLIDEVGDTIEFYDTGLNRIDDPRQSVRFGEMICKPHQCLECDGLMPSEGLARTALYGSFPGANRALITELALVGPILRAVEPLFLTREHAWRYRRAQTTPEARLTAYDTARRGQKSVGTWEMYCDYWRMVRVHVHDSGERRSCHLHLLRWWFVNWNAARIIVDIIAIAFPGFLWKAEQFKQRVFSPEPGPNPNARREK